MGVRQTSLIAYEEVKMKMAVCQAKVRKAIFDLNNNTCNKEIAEYLKWEINRVTPRVKELREQGQVIQKGYKNYNGRKVISWSVI